MRKAFDAACNTVKQTGEDIAYGMILPSNERAGKLFASLKLIGGCGIGFMAVTRPATHIAVGACFFLLTAVRDYAVMGAAIRHKLDARQP